MTKIVEPSAGDLFQSLYLVGNGCAGDGILLADLYVHLKHREDKIVIIIM